MHGKKIITALVLMAVLHSSNTAVAAKIDPFGSTVFRLQKKTAMRGNPLAQYKLGTFYEFGMSVSADLNEAIRWYKKAALKNYQPAVDRLTFHEIKKTKYHSIKHASWLEGVTDAAENSDANALILLGQMHRYGIAVRKDLNKAESLLSRASSLGHSEVDNIIRNIRKKTASKNKIQNKPIAKEIKKKAVVETKQLIKKEVTSNKESEKIATKAAELAKIEQQNQDKKWRRYEAAMKKYYKQQLILQQQQEWSESVEDDE